MLVPPATGTAAVAAPAPAGTASAAAAAVLARLRLIHGETASLDLLAVEGGDGGLGFLVAAHFHEPEPLGSAGVAVHNDLGRLHGPVRREHLFERTVRNPVGKVPHVQLLAHLGLP